ncbi:MAG TPA: autotransporter domain-containing protein, partial [Pseudolabrys sp.]|nr:autotransporter domain-containing protein [Pseudolabrys sp.]
ISPSGIAFQNGTIAGQINSSGIVDGGISLDSRSKITSTTTAISITGPAFTGGISNAGTLSAASGGIIVSGVTSFSGGIANSGRIDPVTGIGVFDVSTFTGGIGNAGTITSGRSGIVVEGVSTFSGGITNAGTGTITATSGFGILVGSNCSCSFVSAFSGNISNAGTISTGGTFGTGIFVWNVSTFTGDIVNSGTITAPSAKGIGVNGGSTFDGNISNSGSITAPTGIRVGNGLGTFTGNISNGGTISGAGTGIVVTTVNMFGTGGGGNIINTGTISVSSVGIHVAGVNTFAGGIFNTGGTISAAAGVVVDFVSIFAGGITNTGKIAATTGPGVFVSGISTFLGGISNAGTISARWGISVTGVKVFGNGGSGGITNSGTIVAASTGIYLGDVSTFAANISNSGTISASTGIAVYGSTINGSIVDNGIIKASSRGILVHSDSKINSTGTAISVTGHTFTGGISNAGTISASGASGFGIYVSGVTTFGGGITNSGTIGAQRSGIWVSGASTFSGGIVNDGAGTITATTQAGIRLGNTTAGYTVSRFSGGISNAGTISAGAGVSAYGIYVRGVSTFAGDIVNSGAITTGRNGIEIQNVDRFAGNIINTTTGIITALSGVGIEICNCVTSFAGGISNAGTISANLGVVVTGVAHFGATSSGGITNSGLIAAATAGIQVSGVSTFMGGIINSAGGTISAPGGYGILVGYQIFGSTVSPVSTFLGGITNAGAISVAGSGIGALAAGKFGGGISNSGAITAGGNAILVGAATPGGIIASVSTFTGGVTNSGTISSTVATGIAVLAAGSFAGGIVNAGGGTITANEAGIRVGYVTASGAYGVSNFTGGITNAGTISSSAVGIYAKGVSTFAGAISNSGTITAQTGIKIDSGVTFASGSHIVNTGVLSGSTAAIDTTLATSPVTIDQNGGTVIGAINLSANADVLNVKGGTINGNIVGAGTSDTLNFTLGSGHSFTYGSAYNFSGINQVNVNSGAVILDGAGNSATNVKIAVGAGLQVGDASNPGADLTSTNAVDVFGTLSGHGSVLGDVFVENGGILLPGGSIGTLTISGNLTLSSGGVYKVEISPTTASNTLVGGIATLGGARVKVVADLGTYSPIVYTILTANSAPGLGTTNTFNPTVTATNGGLTTAVLQYDDPSTCGTVCNVYLSIQGFVNTLVVPAGANQNEQNAAGAINNFILNGGTLPSDFQNLVGLSDGALLTALDQLAGQAGGSFSLGGFQAGGLFLNLMLNPFNDGRGASSNIGPAFGYAPEQHSVAQEAASAFASVDKSPATFDQRFGFWGAGYGGSATVKGDAATGAATTSSRVYGFASGLDYKLSPDTMVGFALAGGGTNWGLDQNLGGGRSDMFQAGLYASTHNGPAYVSGALGYSWSDVTTNRTVLLGGTTTLAGKFRANALSARVEDGYRVPFGDFGVTPYAAGQVQAIFLPSYTETLISGLPSFALTYNSQVATATRGELGAWLDHIDVLKNGARLKLYSRLAWAHDFNNSASVTALFQSLPGSSFTVNTAKPAADSALVTAGAEYKLTNGWSVLGKFDGEFSNTTSIYSGTGVIRKQW